MLYVISSLAILVGGFIILYAIIKYIKTLNFLKQEAFKTKIFTNKTSLICVIMMIFFFTSYIFMLVYFTQINVTNAHCFISFVFLLGSIFVLLMTTIQKEMTSSIIEKNIAVITALINSIEAKDEYTRGHSENVKNIVELFYDALPFYIRKTIDKNNLLTAALLHDVGKIFVPDSIMNNYENASEDDFEILKSHTTNGEKILENIYFNDIPKWVKYHHERVDGLGYFKVTNKNIPIESKMIAIANTFSGLYFDGVYKKSYQFEEAIIIIKNLRGTELDKELVDIFCTIDFDILKNCNIK